MTLSFYPWKPKYVKRMEMPRAVLRVRETGEVIEVEIRDGLIPEGVDQQGWVVEALESLAHKKFVRAALASQAGQQNCEHRNKKVFGYGSFCDDCGRRIR